MLEQVRMRLDADALPADGFEVMGVRDDHATAGTNVDIKPLVPTKQTIPRSGYADHADNASFLRSAPPCPSSLAGLRPERFCHTTLLVIAYLRNKPIAPWSRMAELPLLFVPHTESHAGRSSPRDLPGDAAGCGFAGWLRSRA